MSVPGDRSNFPGMTTEYPAHRVEISFAGPPPVRRIGLANGVSEVEADGPIVRCLVAGSFQPFLEALHGHEVLTLRSTPELSRPATGEW